MCNILMMMMMIVMMMYIVQISSFNSCVQYMFVCYFQLPAVSTLQYNNTLSKLEADKKCGHLQSPERSVAEPPMIRRHNVSFSPSLSARKMYVQQPNFVPITSATSGSLPNETKYVADRGPLSSDMKYPEVHVVPRVGTTHAGYQRAWHGTMATGPRTTLMSHPATVNRDLYRAPAVATNLSAGGSLHRKSTNPTRSRGITFGTRPAGLPPSGYSQKHDWIAASDLEYRV